MKEKKEFTSWDQMKSNNYHYTSLGFILFSLFILFKVEPEGRWISLIPFLIGAVAIPVANYISWRKYFYKKK